jgi:outer membrane protein TolC
MFISIQIFSVKGQIISFEEYLKTLSNKNLLIKIKKNEIKKEEINIKQSYNQFLPKVDFTYGATISSRNDSVYSDYIQEESFSLKPSWTKNLSINLPIFLGGKRFDLIKISKSSKNISQYDLKYTILELKSQAVTLFIKAYNYQNQLKILKKSLSLSKENYDRAVLLKSVGRMVNIDLLTFKLSYEERKNTIFSIKTELENTFIEMSSLANEDIKYSKLKIDVSLPEDILKLTKSDLQKKYVEKMKLNSPLVKKSREYLKISKYNLDLSFKNYYPNISLRYNYSPYTENFWEFPFTKGHSLSLLLNINIFNSFSDSYEYKKSKIDLLNTKFQLDELIKNQEYAIKKAVNILKNSLNQLDSLKFSLKLSKEMLEQIKTSYNLGKSNYLDVLKAENDWFLKENDLLNLNMQIYNSYYQLKVISGDLKEQR